MSNADENRATWKLVGSSIEKYPDQDDSWNRRRAVISTLVKRAVESEFDSLFRAGMSVSPLVFSTLDRHGLRDEPRITVEVTSDWSLRVSYSTWNTWFKQPTQFETVIPRLAFPVFTRYLQHLWEETIPEPIPEVLRKRSNYEADDSGSLI